MDGSSALVGLVFLGVLGLLLLAVVAAGVMLVWRRAVVPVAVRGRRLFDEESLGVRPPLTVATVLSPRGLSRLIFVPRDIYEVRNSLLARLGLLRSLLGLTVWALLSLRYGATGIGAYVERFGNEVTDTVLLAVPLVTLGCLLAVVLAAPDQRSRALRAVFRPLLPAWGGIGLVFLLRAVGLIYFRDDEVDRAAASGGMTWSALANMLLSLWVLAFLVCSTYYAARYTFACADAHPMLAPVLSVALVWLLLAFNLARDAGVSVPLLAPPAQDILPYGVQLSLSLGGAVLMTVLAALEYRHLAGTGLGLRAGPWR
ncbi:hypothetical protein [Streptomyces sp. NPDC093094]|uniref:hypothetical protein n=1 Tax=Streptomyces sp. NPDC093094 TaxID=3366026 RepID=UPI00381959FE